MTTAEKPYGLCISYESLDDAVEVKEEAFFQNAAFLFATIKMWMKFSLHVPGVHILNGLRCDFPIL